MKICVYCGKQYPDDAAFCTVDGGALRAANAPLPAFSAPPYELVRQRSVDTDHLRLLYLFHFIHGGLSLLGLGFLGLHFLFVSAVFGNPSIWKHNPPPFPPHLVFSIIIAVYLLIATLITVFGGLNILSGIFLRQRRHRTFSLVVAGLNCIQIPLGTILGIFTLIVLQRKTVADSYLEAERNSNR